MTKVIADRWQAEHWCKPFGADSDRREKSALVSTFADRLHEFPAFPKQDGIDVARLFTRRAPGHDLGEPNYCTRRRSVVKVRSYAHDRVIISAYLEPARIRGKQIGGVTLRRGLAGVRLLELPRETRRGYKIGNRWRNLPLETKFTTTARNYVRDVAHICEHQHCGHGVFSTLTFPGGTDESFRVMSVGSGYAVDRMNRWLRYKVSGGIFAYVWELQKRGAPHLHYVYRIPDTTCPKAFEAAVKAEWYKILCDMSDQTGVDLFARKSGGTHRGNMKVLQVKHKPLTGTYARYISKYMTKNATKSGGKCTWFPGRWWGVSYAGRKASNAARLETLLPIDDDELAQFALTALTQMVAPLTISAKWFARVPNGHNDSVSIQTGTTVARNLHLCIRHLFLYGDYTALQRYLECNPALIDTTLKERKALHEHATIQLCTETHAKIA